MKKITIATISLLLIMSACSGSDEEATTQTQQAETITQEFYPDNITNATRCVGNETENQLGTEKLASLGVTQDSAQGLTTGLTKAEALILDQIVITCSAEKEFFKQIYIKQKQVEDDKIDCVVDSFGDANIEQFIQGQLDPTVAIDRNLDTTLSSSITGCS